MTTVLALVLVLGVLIFVHELGHFVAAKAAGVRVLKFSLGFGPSIISFTKGETEYAVCWFPLGGYVRMAGEDPEDLVQAEEEGRVPEQGDFAYASVTRRFGIITAGPIMNIVLAFVIYFGLFLVVGDSVIATTSIGQVSPSTLAEAAGFMPGDLIESVDGEIVTSWDDAIRSIQDGIGIMHDVTIDRDGEKIVLRLPSLMGADGGPVEGAGDWYSLLPNASSLINTVSDTGAAAEAGLEPGDRVVRLGEREIESWAEMAAAIHHYAGVETEIEYERGSELFTSRVTPNKVISDSTGATFGWLGVGIDPREWPIEEIEYGLLESIAAGAGETWEQGTLIVDVLVRLITGQFTMSKTLGGPVMIASIAGQSARLGIVALLSFIALVSVNLGVLNLLPIPVLDGGHLVFLSAEAVRGKPLSLRFRLIATQVGMAFIILIMLYVTINDVLRVI